MNKLYIKGDLIQSRNQIILEIDDRQVINPTHEMLINNGWSEYVPSQPTEEQIFEENKQNLYNNILNYDSSDSVNMFYISGLPMWLDKNTRAGLLLRFQAEKASGLDSTTLWHNGMQFPLGVDMAIQMLFAIELYASACYDNTQNHIANVIKLTTNEEIENYDYTVGYPDKLQFTM